MNEQAIAFPCAGETLVGILHPSENRASRGTLIVVGGPQYRVGSHRQFVLLARVLARVGVPVFRFDCRGMGDSTGPPTSFVDFGEDIDAAISAFRSNVPGLDDIVIWGLCDAASAAMMHGWRNEHVDGLILLNPWVRSEDTLARAYLQSYYGRHVASIEFWKRLLGGKVNVFEALKSFGRNLAMAIRRAPHAAETKHDQETLTEAAPYTMTMLRGMEKFTGRALFVLSGDDLTAKEFEQHVAGSERWQTLLSNKRTTTHRIAEADHTFSCRTWQDEVATVTAEWIVAL